MFGGAFALPQTSILGFIPHTGDTAEAGAGHGDRLEAECSPRSPPVAAADGHLVVPFLLALVITTVTASLRAAPLAGGLGADPAGVLLMLVIALGTPEPAFLSCRDSSRRREHVVARAAPAWAPQNTAVSVSEVDPSRASHMRTRRLLAGVAVLAIAGGAGVATSAIANPAQPRHVFRDVIIPPFDIRDYPSPVAGLPQERARRGG